MTVTAGQLLGSTGKTGYAAVTVVYTLIGSLAGRFASALWQPRVLTTLRVVAGLVIAGFGVSGMVDQWAPPATKAPADHDRDQVARAPQRKPIPGRV